MSSKQKVAGMAKRVLNRPTLIMVGMVLLMTACSRQVEKIEATYEDGSKKKVVVYTIVGEDSIPQKETTYHPDGKTNITGFYDDKGKRTGQWVAYGENGKLKSECEYLAGERHGKHCVYYDSGIKRYEGENDHDQRIGVWKFWDASGNLIKTVDYDQEKEASAKSKK